MKNPLRNSSLSQQLALATAGMCLLVSFALVTLAAISTRHMQLQQQEEYGSALARQIATRISAALETGDLLSVAASLQRFLESSSAEEVAIFDVEGKALGQAGKALGQNLQQYSAQVRVESDIAGKVVITISTDDAGAARLQFVLSLLGLAVLLSLTVYITTRHFSQRLANQLGDLARSIALEDQAVDPVARNELASLARNISALPMDLLRTRSETNPREENYRTTAVLYLHLTSLADYVDTLDEQALHRYTNRLHQLVLAAANFYAGDLQVARQFGLAIYFSGPNSAGSAAFRAASCAWLIQSASPELEQQMRRTLSMAMAISQSELGVGDPADIYPGLYIQHTLDELEAICANRPPRILLSPVVCEDPDIASRLQHEATEVMDFAMLEEFAEPYQDLLERQLRLILRRLLDPARG
ncbi:MAG: hypothetical protein OEW92_01190 [Gammaproteobacteria bacterium]|nr:hypothetical protein [Gammaproteobacteria bacterium]MDH5171004.1 hypothetical protein [Gammaproteobacteria bacterium]